MDRLLSRCSTGTRSGTTLIEMVFAMSGLTVVLGLALALYSLGLDTYQSNCGGNQAMGAAASAAAYIKRDLRNAASVLQSYSGYSADDDTLILRIPSYDGDGVIDGAYDYVIYELGDDALVRTVIAGPGSTRTTETGRPLVRKVSDLQFAYVVHDFFEADGSTSVFSLSVPWISTPQCFLDGTAVEDGVSYSIENHSAYLAIAPSDGSTVHFMYTVDISQTAAPEAVSEVICVIDAVPDSELQGSARITAAARLRNKN